MLLTDAYVRLGVETLYSGFHACIQITHARFDICMLDCVLKLPIAARDSMHTNHALEKIEPTHIHWTVPVSPKRWISYVHFHFDVMMLYALSLLGSQIFNFPTKELPESSGTRCISDPAPSVEYIEWNHMLWHSPHWHFHRSIGSTLYCAGL